MIRLMCVLEMKRTMSFSFLRLEILQSERQVDLEFSKPQLIVVERDRRQSKSLSDASKWVAAFP